MSELSRARNKISALKKDIRRLEGLLKGVSKPSPCVRELIQADDHDNEQTMFELIFKNVITELKDNFISLWKTYQEAIQEGAQKETTLQDTIRRKDEKIASLERLLPHMKKKLKNQKAQLKSLQQRLTKAKTEIETHKNYADLVKDSNAEKEKLLKEANKQLSERKSRHADLEMLLRCCQDSEQELMDKVDEVNDRLCETEHRRLSLETTCLAQSVRLQELEMENRVWKEKCVRMEYSLSQSSPVLSEQQLYNDIDSLMPPENVPESNEENLMGHECPTVEFVPPCPQFSLLGTENLKALSNGYPPLRSKNDSPLSDRNDPSSRDTNDSFSGSKSHIPLKKDYKLTTDSLPELSADRKRARHKDFNPRQLLSSHRKRKLSGCSVVLSKRIPNSRSVYSPRPKPGMKRSCYYRRQWVRRLDLVWRRL
jgi:myosin heavy subunit